MALTLARTLAPTLVRDTGTRIAPASGGRSRRAAPRLALARSPRETPVVRALQFTEDALLSRLCHGDDAAYEELVRTYGPRMLVVARSYVPSHEDAEDVLQSAFLLVFRFIHKFKGGSKLSTWLHRIVVNCSLMSLRSGRRHPEARLAVAPFDNDDSVPESAADVDAVADELEQRESYSQVLSAIERLPETLRAAVRLRDVDGLTFAETALLSGRSLTAVRCAAHRGRIALRKVLAPDGEFWKAR